jgi:mono/diheme cytochrome c family protein
MKWRMASCLRLGGILAAGVLAAGCFTERQNSGARLYAAHCSNCHGDQGQGLQRLIPPLAGADYLAKNRESLACLVRHGVKGPMVVNGITFNQVMPGHKEDLTDSEITNLLNFVQTSWGNKGEPFTIREVMDQLHGCSGSDGQ